MASRNVKNFEFKLGKLGLLIFTCGMALLVFAVFLFGVKVGKDMDSFPERYSPRIPDMIKGWLPWTKGERRVAAKDTGSKPASQDGPFDLTFYDTLSKKQTEDKSSPAGGIGEGKSTAEATKVLVPPPNAPAEKKTTAENVQPSSAQPPAEAVATSASPQQAKERFLIQVASYRKKESAEVLCRKIRTLGYNPRIAMVTLPSKGKWYRVTLDGFEDRAQAERVAGFSPTRWAP